MPKPRLTIIIFFLLIFSACTSQNSPAIELSPTPVSTLRAQPTGDSVKVGVLAIRSAAAANAQYGGIIAYIEEQIGQPVTLVPLTQEDQFSLMESGGIDFTFNNPLAGIQVQRTFNTEILVTLARNNTGPTFSGLIIVNKNSGITSIEDLKGKNGTCVNQQTAAAGCIFQVHHLQQKGVDPFTDFNSFTETPSQDNIVLGVLNGSFDVGFIRTGQLERMLRENTILTLDDFLILDQAEDDFFFPHSTALYPEWPFAAHPDTDPELVNQVRKTLLEMPEDHPALTEINSTGFVEPLDYSAMHELIESLQLKSWDAQ
ncbi:MAG: phosphate/phosphite/phosphonate ABC transporter substrate-binding protein [Anaerolineae bacterium]